MGKTFKSLEGSFLVASPKLMDPYFSKSVVFVHEHDEKGAQGWIINKEAHFGAKPLFDGFEVKSWIHQQKFFMGGPLQANQVSALYLKKSLAEASNCIEDLKIALSFDEISSLRDLSLKSSEFRLYLGHSAWAKGQLEAELIHGFWKKLPFQKAMIFSGCPGLVWKQSLCLLGGEYILLSQMPEEEDLSKN
jgi:putative transcriptional regulator